MMIGNIYLVIGAIVMAFFESYHTDRRVPLWRWYLAITTWPIFALLLPWWVWRRVREIDKELR